MNVVLVEESIVTESPGPYDKKVDSSYVLKRSNSGITIGCVIKKAHLRKSSAKSVVNSLKKPLDNNIL